MYSSVHVSRDICVATLDSPFLFRRWLYSSKLSRRSLICTCESLTWSPNFKLVYSCRFNVYNLCAVATILLATRFDMYALNLWGYHGWTPVHCMLENKLEIKQKKCLCELQKSYWFLRLHVFTIMKSALGWFWKSLLDFQGLIHRGALCWNP